MDTSWSKAFLFCLAAGLAWGLYKELSDSRGPGQGGGKRAYRPARAVLLGLAAGAACLAGLVLLTYLGLTEPSRF